VRLHTWGHLLPHRRRTPCGIPLWRLQALESTHRPTQGHPSGPLGPIPAPSGSWRWYHSRPFGGSLPPDHLRSAGSGETARAEALRLLAQCPAPARPLVRQALGPETRHTAPAAITLQHLSARPVASEHPRSLCSAHDPLRQTALEMNKCLHGSDSPGSASVCGANSHLSSPFAPSRLAYVVSCHRPSSP